MSDYELKTTLTADGSPLTNAMKTAEKQVENFRDTVTQSSTSAASAAQTATAAITAQGAAAAKGATAASAAANANREAEVAAKRLGVSAGQTAAAMRQLPAQITDVVTSLASGMPVWMVAIQQGGQIKDAFGGIGPAFTAITSKISPLVAGIGAVGTAAAVAALAYARGSAEADEYSRSIIMSGNAAGTTVSKLTAMAESIDNVVGTQADAANALAQLTASGQVANRNLESIATTSVRMQRVLGQSIEASVKQFEELGRKPLETSAKLNQSYGYLTASIYDRIKALEKQGKLDQAGELAQQAYAKAMDDRTRQIQANAGTIERAWKGIKDIAAEAWDAMLGIGRQKTTQQELDLVGKQLEALDSRKSNNPQRTDALRETLRQRQAELQEQLRFETRSAQSQANERQSTDKHIRDAEEAEKKRAATEAAARQAAEARTKASVERIKNDLKGMTGAYGDAERLLDVQREAGIVSENEYWQAKRALIALEEQAQLRALEQENRVLAAQKATGADKIRLDAEIASNVAEMARVRAKASADVAIANAQEAAGITKLSRAQQEYLQQLREAEATRQRQHERELASFGRGDAARDLAGRQNAVDDRVFQQRQQLDSDRLGGRLTESEYQARLSALQAYHERALQAEVGYQAQRQALEANGMNGFTRALENYLDSARNVASQTEQLFSRAFQGMEDAVVQFAMKGKVSFSSFAESVIADLIRIYVRQQMAGLLGSAGNFFSGLFGGSSGGTPINGSAGVPFIPANVAHGGGIMGHDSFQQRSLPASTWRDAPRFHTGFAADEYAAVLQKGESVFTPEQLRHLQPVGGGSPVNVSMPVNVYNNNASQSQVTTRRNSEGGLDILIDAVEATMADRVGSGQGPMSQALEGRYGMRPAMA